MAYIKLLSDDEIDYLNKKYKIEITDDYLTVRTFNFNRTTFHKLNDNVRLKFESNDCQRSMIITPRAIQLWKNNFQTHSLVDVQNVINTLAVLSQDITVENISNLFKRKHTKIITI